jgi:hypothetical protein
MARPPIMIDPQPRALAASLEEVLSTSQIIVIFAAVTSENQGTNRWPNRPGQALPNVPKSRIFTKVL